MNVKYSHTPPLYPQYLKQQNDDTRGAKKTNLRTFQCTGQLVRASACGSNLPHYTQRKVKFIGTKTAGSLGLPYVVCVTKLDRPSSLRKGTVDLLSTDWVAVT
jgi:hypothetical protein